MKRAIRTGLLVTSLFAGAAIIAIVVAVRSIDYNSYLKLVANEIKKATGRELNCRGDISLKVSLEPEVFLDNVSFANAPWGKDRNMIDIDLVKVKMRLLPLLKGKIIVSTIVLDGVDLWLETDNDGRGNWLFVRPSNEGNETKKEARTVLPIVHLIAVNSSRIQFLDGKTGEQNEYKISFLLTNTTTLDRPLKIVSDIVYNKHPIYVDGVFGSVSQLFAGRPFPISLQGTSGNDSVSINGTVNPDAHGGDFTMSVDAAGQNVAELAALVNLELQPVGPYSIAGIVNNTPSGLDFSGIQLKAGKSDLSGDVALNMSNEQFGIRGQLFTSLLALSDFRLPQKESEAKAGAQDHDQEGFNLDFLRAVDLDLSIKGRKILYDDLVFDDVTITGILADGNLAVDQLVFGLKGAKVESTLTAAADSEKYSFTLTAKGDNIAELASLWKMATPPVGPYSIAGEIDLKSSGYDFKKVELTIGQSHLSGDLKLDLRRARPGISARLSSNLLAVDDFLEPGKEAKKMVAEDAGQGGKIFPQADLDLDFLKMVDLDLYFVGKRIRQNKLIFDEVVLKLISKNGNLTVDQYDFNLQGGKVESKITVTDEGDQFSLTSFIKASKIPLGQLLQNLEITDKLDGGKLNLRLDLRGKGRSVSSIMAGLDGQVFLDVVDGRINDSAIDYAGADLLTEFIQGINPFAKNDKFTELQCGTINFQFKDGKSTNKKGIGIETEKMKVSGGGSIDLQAEYLDLAIRPKANKGIGIGVGSFANLVRLQGPLRKPELNLDELGVARGAASIGMAFATGGLSILGETILGKITADASPCKTTRESL